MTSTSISNCSYSLCLNNFPQEGLKTSKCGRCKVVQYCKKDCQRNHWPAHKKFCVEKVDEVGAGISSSSTAAGAGRAAPASKVENKATTVPRTLPTRVLIRLNEKANDLDMDIIKEELLPGPEYNWISGSGINAKLRFSRILLDVLNTLKFSIKNKQKLNFYYEFNLKKDEKVKFLEATNSDLYLRQGKLVTSTGEKPLDSVKGLEADDGKAGIVIPEGASIKASAKEVREQLKKEDIKSLRITDRHRELMNDLFSNSKCNYLGISVTLQDTTTNVILHEKKWPIKKCIEVKPGIMSILSLTSKEREEVKEDLLANTKSSPTLKVILAIIDLLPSADEIPKSEMASLLKLT